MTDNATALTDGPGFWLVYVGLLVIIWGRYMIAAGGFHLYVWGRPEHRVAGTRLAQQRPRSKTVWREMRTSMATAVVYALPAAVMIFAWDRGGTRIMTEVTSAWQVLWLPLSVFVYFFLHDTYFYWTHRAMHHPWLYARTHRTHHASKQPTSWAAFCFHPWEALISAWFVPALSFVIPIHISALLVVLTVATFSSVANHAGWEVFPKRFLDSFIGRQLITARHHNLHHTRFQRNFGLYFRCWDKWMGTDDMSGDPMGPEKPIRGKNSV